MGICKFDIEAWHCVNCGRDFYTETDDEGIGEDVSGLTCPYGCSGDLEFRGRFEASGRQTAVGATIPKDKPR